MKVKNQVSEIIEPKIQTELFGYDEYFNYFVKLFENKNTPNCILLSGQKGLGKATFSYHLVNYLLSQNEKLKYNTKNFFIDENNFTYKSIQNNIHPNFFLIENKSLEREIKIEQVRNLLKFLAKSTYSKDLKIVLIDNTESLNLNSSNALLKAIEEPSLNTFFILIHDNTYQILQTIKSRCIEFKIFLTQKQKQQIFVNLLAQYKKKYDYIDSDNLYFETPGNLIKYISHFDQYENKISSILHLIDNFKKEKRFECLTFITSMVQKVYNNLLLNEKKASSTSIYNYKQILKIINEMKIYNLDEKNSFLLIKNILANETR